MSSFAKSISTVILALFVMVPGSPAAADEVKKLTEYTKFRNAAINGTLSKDFNQWNFLLKEYWPPEPPEKSDVPQFN